MTYTIQEWDIISKMIHERSTINFQGIWVQTQNTKLISFWIYKIMRNKIPLYLEFNL